MKISEIKIWLVHSTSNLKAKIDLTLSTDWGLVAMKGFRLIQMEGSAPFVCVPQEKYQSKPGDTVYKDILWLDRSLQSALFPKMIEAYYREIATPKVTP